MRLLAVAILGPVLSACMEKPRVGPRVDAASACSGASAIGLDRLWTDHLSPSAPTGCASLACHGGGAGGLAFRTALELHAAVVGRPSFADSGTLLVAPGDPLKSLLYARLLPAAPGQMPLGGPYLEDAGREAVLGWICSGAPQADNPVPSISWISPSTVTAGAGPFVVTIHGAGFLPASTVRIDGSARDTLYRSGSELTVDLLVSDVSVVGTHTLTVSTPGPGGGTSGGVALTVAESPPENPVPAISSISPRTLAVGATDLGLTVEGSGFCEGSVVEVDGAPRGTVYQGTGSLLTATLLASDVAEPGTRVITVSNPTPGGGTSGGASLSVENPVPSIASIAPDSVAAGAGALVVTVQGSGFVASSTVHVDGSPRTTTVESGVRLTAELLASDTAGSGDRIVTVVSSPPGGGASGGTTLTVTSLPHVTTLSPCGAVAGRDVSVTVDGFNFAPGATATVDGGSAAVTFVDATRLTLSIPASLLPSAPPTNLVPVVVTNPGSSPSEAAYFGIASQASTLAANVQPILDANCTSCHKGAGAKANLRLEAARSYASLVGVASAAAGCAPTLLVAACGPLPAQSVLVDKIVATGTAACAGDPMPPSSGQSGALSASDVKAIVDWIAQGAPP